MVGPWYIVYTSSSTMFFYMRAWLHGEPCRMYNHGLGRVEYQDLPVLWPDEFAKAIYKYDPTVFHHMMMGSMSEEDAVEYWEHCSNHCAWFRAHPSHQYPRKGRLIPLSLYGDEVQCYRNSEVGSVACIAWTTDFGYGHESLLRYYPICCYSEHCASEDTYDDVMSELAPRLTLMVDMDFVHEWSSSGYAFMLSSIQGDLKWVHAHYGLHNYRRNNFCSFCGCLKVHPDPTMTISDFRLSAQHINTPSDLSEFHDRASPIFTVPGATIGRVQHDCMHSQLLGTGKIANGSAIVYLVERSFWNGFQAQGGDYADAMDEALRIAHKDFLHWKRQNSLDVTQPRFSCARLSRRNRQSYACLSSKAAPSKAVTLWIATRSVEFALLPTASEMDKQVAGCLHSYAAALKLMDESPLVLSQEQADFFHTNIMAHLQLFAQLNKSSREIRGRMPGRNLWMIIPKAHHLMHFASVVQVECLNPKAWSLFMAEDFIGRISRIARVCHRSSVSMRTLERYLALILLAIQRI